MTERARNFIERLLAIVASGQPERLDELLGEPIVFHTPRFLRPHTDRRIISQIVQSIPRIIEGFHYERTWACGDEALMEFKGRIGRWELHGLDIFTIGADGRASELTVFIRPPKGLEALGQAEDALAQAFAAQAAPG